MVCVSAAAGNLLNEVVIRGIILHPMIHGKAGRLANLSLEELLSRPPSGF